MSDAKHSPPRDRSFLLSLGRHVGAGIGLVVLVAALFWGIGQLRTEPAREDLAIGEGPGPSPSPTAPGSPAPTSPDGMDETAPSPPGEASPSPTPTLAPDATASPSEEQVAPGEISVQLLDAAGDGGGAAAEVADALSGEGFDLVVTNPAAVAYDVTTVFWTQGEEAKARQLAATMGYDTIEEQPGNLSESVDVHVVVGRDQR